MLAASHCSAGRSGSRRTPAAALAALRSHPSCPPLSQRFLWSLRRKESYTPCPAVWLRHSPCLCCRPCYPALTPPSTPLTLRFLESLLRKESGTPSTTACAKLSSRLASAAALAALLASPPARPPQPFPPITKVSGEPATQGVRHPMHCSLRKIRQLPGLCCRPCHMHSHPSCPFFEPKVLGNTAAKGVRHRTHHSMRKIWQPPGICRCTCRHHSYSHDAAGACGTPVWGQR